MYILGVSCFFHDAAACLLKDGEIIAAASEERFTRKKHDADFPVNAIDYCLRQGEIIIDQVDYVGFYDKPFIKFDRILTTYIYNFPKSYKAFIKALPLWLKRKLWMHDIFQQEVYYDGEIIFGEHHLSHAASAFLVSPFREAAILTVDGVGEWATTTYGWGRDNNITLLKEIRFPHSLGLLYSAFTYYLGFKVNSDEYKVMGLAPYGKPTYYDKILDLIEIRDDGSFRMDMKYFAYHYGLTMTNKKFDDFFDAQRRVPESAIEQRHCDIAASIQKVTEDILLRMLNSLYQETKSNNVCLAGGVALNSVANGKVLKQTPFENIFIQPAAGDAGGALGVASFIYHTLLGNKRNFQMEHAYWGPGYSDHEIDLFLTNEGIPFKKYSPSDLIRKTAQLISEGNVIGWFQGRMEFGPRALGNRSILADARNPAMKDLINQKVKFRESFRPFAPTILEESVAEYFELDRSSPFMLLVANVKEDKKSELPAITHIDGTARIQTINQQQNPLYYALLNEFYQLTRCPVLLNTSFNVRGEPIVCSPRDAVQCFKNTGMDYLVMGYCIIEKS